MKEFFRALLKGKGSKVKVNDTFISRNSSVSGMVINGDLVISSDGVYIDGKKVEDSNKLVESKEIKIEIYGNVEVLESRAGDINVSQDVGIATVKQGTLNVKSNVLGDATVSQGNLDIEGSVLGNVQNKMGNIDIRGNVGGTPTVKMGNINISAKKVKELKNKQESKDKDPNSLFTF